MRYFIDDETPCLIKETREPEYQDVITRKKIPVYLKE
jgi:hypothetical protein